MKRELSQSIKLDLILKCLYDKRFDGKFHSVETVLEKLKIPFRGCEEAHALAKRLEEDGFVDANPISLGQVLVSINTHGIDYCENSSYTDSKSSIVNTTYNFNITDSPNANIINQSSNICISQEYRKISNIVDEIRDQLLKENYSDKSKMEEIHACLNEIQQCVQRNVKPKFAIKSLIDIAGGISSIASWLTILGQFAGVIPPLPG